MDRHDRGVRPKEDWLMNNGYMQAEAVTNLDQLPATGALVAVGFPRLRMRERTAACDKPKGKQSFN